MVDERAQALARRLTAHGRVLRRGRIFARLREGWDYDEIAAQERLTAERVRQIVRQALEKRIIDESAEHAKLQLARLQPAMRLAGEAIADGDVTAIAPLMEGARPARPLSAGREGRPGLTTTRRAEAHGQDQPGRRQSGGRRGEGGGRRPSGWGGLRKNGPRGRRKSLKRLDSDKEIKEIGKAFLVAFDRFSAP